LPPQRKVEKPRGAQGVSRRPHPATSLPRERRSTRQMRGLRRSVPRTTSSAQNFRPVTHAREATLCITPCLFVTTAVPPERGEFSKLIFRCRQPPASGVVKTDHCCTLLSQVSAVGRIGFGSGQRPPTHGFALRRGDVEITPPLAGIDTPARSIAHCRLRFHSRFDQE
jgi:hypothetical protein